MDICAEKCTACRVCKVVCPKGCIIETREKDGRVIMQIDDAVCIGCNSCKRICPQLAPTNVSYPIKAFAAWNSINEEHLLSASGGIASAIYRYCTDNGWLFVGTVYNEKNHTVSLQIGSTVEDIERFRGSKYVHSDANHVYRDIKSSLLKGKNVVFIGLPCQVAGLKNYVKNLKHDGALISIDLVCHGTPPAEYLQEHIVSIAQKKNEKVKNCLFRDPEYGTNNFVFTLRNTDNKCFYVREVVSDDYYQMGFHRAVLYRENCYSCSYARPERCGDLTLGDYKGLGSLEKYVGNRHQVSCVLVSSSLGLDFFQEIIKKKYITATERPVDEPIRSDHQLNSPSIPHKARKSFIAYYEQGEGFEIACEKSLTAFIRKKLFLKKFNIKKF